MGNNAKTRLLAFSDYVALDTETTGLSTEWCELIEVAAVRYHDGQKVESFQELVRPELFYIPEFITELTGITEDMLYDARMIEDVLPEYLGFIGDSPVVGQSVCFDLRFIAAASGKCGLGQYSPIAVDVARLSRILMPELANHKLHTTFEECCKIAGYKPDFGRSHRARTDSEMAAFCYEVLKPMLVDRFGDDPEREYLRQQKSRGADSYKQYLSDLAPTVDTIDESNPFFGCNVCFTGKLSSLTRKEAWQVTVNLGATPQPSVTKKTDYLVLGSFDFSASLKGEKSSKLKKAEQLLAKSGSPEIVSEDFFVQFAPSGDAR